MGRTSLNVLLLMALLSVVFLTWRVRRNFTERNDQLLPGMVSSVSYQAEATNANFPDGKTLREPVGGSIGRGFPPLHYRPTPDDAVRAGKELQNPVQDSSGATLQRGATVFSIFCQPCHGAGATGDGLIGKRGFPPPPSLLTEKAIKLEDGQIFHIISFGQGNMPSLASQIMRGDRWNVIKHVRSLQRAQVLEPFSKTPFRVNESLTPSRKVAKN